MKKLLTWGAGVAGAAGILLMLLGGIAVLAGGAFLHHNWYNYFYSGEGFVILGIFLLLGALLWKQSEK